MEGTIPHRKLTESFQLVLIISFMKCSHLTCLIKKMLNRSGCWINRLNVYKPYHSHDEMKARCIFSFTQKLFQVFFLKWSSQLYCLLQWKWNTNITMHKTQQAQKSKFYMLLVMNYSDKVCVWHSLMKWSYSLEAINWDKPNYGGFFGLWHTFLLADAPLCFDSRG